MNTVTKTSEMTGHCGLPDAVELNEIPGYYFLSSFCSLEVTAVN